jgi:hypothetical protein
MTALEIGLIQQGGIVWVAFEEVDRRDDGTAPLADSKRIDPDLLRHLASVYRSMPTRVLNIHFCSSQQQGRDHHQLDPPDLLVDSVAKSNKIQPLFHYGKLETNSGGLHLKTARSSRCVLSIRLLVVDLRLSSNF